MAHLDEPLEELVSHVTDSAKYRAIDLSFVREIARIELAKGRGAKETVKAVRGKLHQVGSAYQEKPIPYPQWKKHLEDLPEDLRAPDCLTAFQQNLALHASTRERLSILPRFFAETLALISPVNSILDLACGLTPLALPWMPAAKNVRYQAVDIYPDMVEYLNLFFAHFNIAGKAAVVDLTREVPADTAQVAFLLKTIPCLEQVDKLAGKRLLEGLKTENILVSFPSRSLGGRSKGMSQNYEAHFWSLVESKNWKITRFEFPGELAFLIQK